MLGLSYLFLLFYWYPYFCTFHFHLVSINKERKEQKAGKYASTEEFMLTKVTVLAEGCCFQFYFSRLSTLSSLSWVGSDPFSRYLSFILFCFIYFLRFFPFVITITDGYILILQSNNFKIKLHNCEHNFIKLFNSKYLALTKLKSKFSTTQLVSHKTKTSSLPASTASFHNIYQLHILHFVTNFQINISFFTKTCNNPYNKININWKIQNSTIPICIS